MDDRAPLKLKREVEPPQRTGNGMGVMVVACAAMFFAVAGSAFILRARMAHVEAARAEARMRAQQPPVQAPLAPATATTCGEPEIVLRADGTRSVVYTPCEPPAQVRLPDGATGHATELPENLELRLPDNLDRR